MTVRWVLAVMLVTTLVATHSHSPWSSLLRARNWRLPLGRALCLLLLGFPTLAKQGAGKRMEVGIQVKGQMLTTHESREDENGGALPEPIANSPLLSANVASPHNIRPVHTGLSRTTPWIFCASPTAQELQSPGTFLQVMTGKGSPAAAQGMSSSRPASCLYSQPGSTVKYGGS